MLLEIQDLLVLADLTVLLEVKVFPVQREPPVLRVLQVLLEVLDRPVQLGLKVHFQQKVREALIWVRWS